MRTLLTFALLTLSPSVTLAQSSDEIAASVRAAADAGDLELARGRAMGLPESFLADEALATELWLDVLRAAHRRARRASSRPAYGAALVRSVFLTPLLLVPGSAPEASAGLVHWNTRRGHLVIPDTEANLRLIENTALLLHRLSNVPECGETGTSQTDGLIEQIVTRHPGRIRARQILADSLWAAGVPEGAREHYREILRRRPEGNPDYVVERAREPAPEPSRAAPSTTETEDGLARVVRGTLGDVAGGRVDYEVFIEEQGFGYTESSVVLVRGRHRQEVFSNMADSSWPHVALEGREIHVTDSTGNRFSPGGVTVRIRWDAASSRFVEIGRREESTSGEEVWQLVHARMTRALRRGQLAWARGEMTLMGSSPDCAHRDLSFELVEELARGWRRRVSRAAPDDARALTRAFLERPPLQARVDFAIDLRQSAATLGHVAHMLARVGEDDPLTRRWMDRVLGGVRGAPELLASADAIWDAGLRGEARRWYRRYLEASPRDAAARATQRAGSAP